MSGKAFFHSASTGQSASEANFLHPAGAVVFLVARGRGADGGAAATEPWGEAAVRRVAATSNTKSFMADQITLEMRQKIGHMKEADLGNARI